MSVIKKDWDDKLVLSKVDGLLKNYDDGELFVEEVFSENILFDENKIKNASFDQDRGFGLRAVREDSINFYHSSDVSKKSLLHGITSLKKSNKQPQKINNLRPNLSLYSDTNPISQLNLKKKLIF